MFSRGLDRCGKVSAFCESAMAVAAMVLLPPSIPVLVSFASGSGGGVYPMLGQSYKNSLGVVADMPALSCGFDQNRNGAVSKHSSTKANAFFFKTFTEPLCPDIFFVFL